MAGLGKIVVVCGPTATGKSALALALARRFGGQLVGADSMQIYRELTIGTAALTAKQAGGVPQHLVGFLPPEQSFSVADWLGAAREAIAGIQADGGLPVVCGGTGLYIKDLLDGRLYAAEKPDPALRQALADQWEALGGESMLMKLAEVDPQRAARLNVADKKRILRALEGCIATGQTAAQRDAASTGGPVWPALCLGLDYPQRAELYAAADSRVDAMMDEGLLDEARQVYANRERYITAAQAIGYKEFFPFFEKAAPLETCVEDLKRATRRYAKRQLTWFRKMPQVQWLAAGGVETEREALCLAEDFLSREPD